MNLFFKSYQRKEDDFRDEVVNHLLAMNDSTGIIFDLVQKYGQPRWEVERTISKKSENLLFVPVNTYGKDSISAVFAFMDSIGHTYLKIFEAQSSDTLVSDFVLLYQGALYCNGSDGKRIVKPQLKESKDYIEAITDCWHVYTSSDGGTTLNYSYSSCKTTIVRMTPPVFDFGGSTGSSDDGNGGTSGTGTTSPNTTTLSDPAKNNLKNAEEKLKDGPCLSETIMDSTWNNSLTITINSGITEIARYNSLTGKLEFRDVGSITDRVLLHELLHAYQTMLYDSGYVHTRTHEFEAWLLVDLYLVSQNMDKNNLTWTKGVDSDQFRSEYYDWVKSIYENGFTTGLGGNSNMCTFWRDAFITAVPEYEKLPKGTTTFPNTIDNLISNCQKTVL